MTADNKYSEVLLELRTKYEQALAKLEAEASQIKARLASLDTLIDDPLLGSDILSILQDASDSATPTALASNVAEEAEPKAEAKPKKAAPKASPSTSKKSASQAKKKKQARKKTSGAFTSSRPMQWPYTEMFKIDAIEKIMRENPGKVMHTDDLILQLYGELSGDDLKTERDRVNNTMYKGIQKGRWRKVPEEPLSYIFEGNSEAKSKESPTAQAKKSSKKT